MPHRWDLACSFGWTSSVLLPFLRAVGDPTRRTYQSRVFGARQAPKPVTRTACGPRIFSNHCGLDHSSTLISLNSETTTKIFFDACFSRGPRVYFQGGSGPALATGSAPR